jgi:uncharacterized protein (TIGR03437 family)
MKLGVGSFNTSENPGYLRNRIDPNTYTRTYPSDDGAFGLYRSFSGERWIVEAKVGHSFPAPFLPDFATGRRFFLHLILGDIDQKGRNEVVWMREREDRTSSEVTSNRVIVQFTEGGAGGGVPGSGLGGDPARGIAIGPNAADTYVVCILREDRQVTVQHSADGVQFTTVAQRTFTASLGSVQTLLLTAAWAGAAVGYADYDYVSAQPSAPMAISAEAVVNGSSFRAGPVAPGEILTLFGSGIGPPTLTGLRLTSAGLVDTALAETRVLFDGTPAPLIYVRSDQVSVVAPYALSGRSTTQLQAEYQGRRSNTVTVPVVSSAPGIFTLDASGRGQGVVVNQDGTLNGPANPAPRGSIVVILATGEGQTQPAGVDGKPAAAPLPAPRLPVAVSIGGANAEEVLYAGGAPGLVAGVMQVNVRIPAGATPGGAVPLVLKVGEVSSQPGLTMAVQ